MPKAKLPSSRTVKPDAKAIRQLRLSKGWRVEDLARKARCSVKTIENVENGSNVYYFTLNKLAEALGVDFDSLTPNASKVNFSEQVSTKAKGMLFVQIKIDEPYDQFDESEQLITLIRSLCSLLKIRSEVGVVRVDAGSTIIVLQMHQEEMRKILRDSINDYEILSPLKVISFRVGIEPGVWHMLEQDDAKGETAS